MDMDHGQEVIRQVPVGLGNANSVDMPRSLSPHSRSPSCHSAIDEDLKLSEIYRLRVVELERALKLATLGKESGVVREQISHTNFTVPAASVNPADGKDAERTPPIDLPRVELTTFDGEASQYWKFIRQFETYVESKVSDPGQRFLYLMHYCRGKAREAIEECVMLSSAQGYDTARGILKDLYGQPFHVARTLIDKMLTEAKRARGDQESLARLAVRMQNCSIALEQMRYNADLDALHTLEAVVRCLPNDMQHRWADEAETINRSGREPSFRDLTEFIRGRARVANSRFGQLACSGKESRPTGRERPPDGPRPNRFSTNFAVIGENSVRPSCPLCNHDHALAHCEKFSQLSVPARWSTAKEVGACFICLITSHRAANCRRRVRCGVNGCVRSHHALLHVDNATNGLSTTPQGQCLLTTTARKPIRMGTVPVGVVTPHGVVTVTAFLDNGSDTTLISEDFVRRHGLETRSASLAISTVNGTETKITQKLTLQLVPLDGSRALEPVEAYTISDLPMRAAPSMKSLAERWSHLQGIHFEETATTEVEILLGCDVPEAHWAMEQRVGGRMEPYATRSVLGWVLFGPLSTQLEGTSCINWVSATGNEIEETLQRMYDHEFHDTHDDDKTLSMDDREALAIVEEGVRLLPQRIEVPLPWGSQTRTLPNNRIMAERRLELLARRLGKDDELKGRYCEAMQRNVVAGYVERVREELPRAPNIWYLPHHPVINPRKPDKTRVVFDCAARFQGISLNDRLLQGPDWTTPLVGVLCRFRLGRIAVTADIKEMFMQVGVPASQRDALRFLWWDDGDFSQPVSEYRFTVHPFGAVSSPFCANFALRKAIDQNKASINGTPHPDIHTHFYVDDLLCSFETENCAREYINTISCTLKKYGFHLTKWLSNSRVVLESVLAEDRATSARDVDGTRLPTERMLGIQWDAERDKFILKLEIPTRSNTRRGVLSAISSLFDPLGLVAPWLLPGKLLLQRLCRQRLGWDAELEEDDRREWCTWLNSLTSLGEVRIKRALPPSTITDVAELHVFADASEEGYGAVAYGIWEVSGVRQPHLLFGKARVAPLKTVTIPRLELTAAVLAVKVANLMHRSFEPRRWQTYFWTDSAIVLHYIRNRKTRFCTFIANRLAVIHSRSEPTQWRHIRSEENPADLCSRGQTNLRNLQTWLQGPTFLKEHQDKWTEHFPDEVNDDQLEVKRPATVLVTTTTECFLDHFNRYDHWVAVLRAASWLRRFTRFVELMAGRREDKSLQLGPIGKKEMEATEVTLLHLIQHKFYPDEVRILSGGNEQERAKLLRTSSLKKLRPVMIDGLLRVGGRLSHADLEPPTQHPIFLPVKHHLTTLIVQAVHAREGHAGIEHLWNTLRRRFWIVKGKSWVRGLVSRCAFCRKQNARVGQQLMSDLPISRVNAGWRPFATTGVDYFGPLQVRGRRGMEKRYGCLLTCFQSRAVHLELVRDMSTDSFLMALQRFIARRGVPDVIVSDNGSNFVGAHNELRRWATQVDRRMLVTRSAPHGIEWQFNPPYASHRGGVWERLIRSVRRVILAVVGQQTLDDETLHTVLVEAERIVNNRPLVPAPADSTNVALTPNDLLQLHNNPGVNVPRLATNTIHQGWRQANLLAKTFWRRWIAEYLPTLQRRQRWWEEKRQIQLNDVVLVAEEGVERDRWPIGVVKECLPDADGRVRTVKIKTVRGEIVRDIRRVCYLEGEMGEEGDEAGRMSVSGAQRDAQISDTISSVENGEVQMDADVSSAEKSE